MDSTEYLSPRSLAKAPHALLGLCYAAYMLIHSVLFIRRCSGLSKPLLNIVSHCPMNAIAVRVKLLSVNRRDLLIVGFTAPNPVLYGEDDISQPKISHFLHRTPNHLTKFPQLLPPFPQAP